MAKLGWKSMQGNSLWSKVLNAKYGSVKRNLERRLPHEASHLSRSMSKGFEMLRAGIQWDIDERPCWSLEEDGKSFLASAY